MLFSKDKTLSSDLESKLYFSDSSAFTETASDPWIFIMGVFSTADKTSTLNTLSRLLVKENANAKFNETIEAHARLGIDPKYTDQQLRTTVALPKGTGQEIKIAVIAKGEKVAEAKAAAWTDKKASKERRRRRLFLDWAGCCCGSAGSVSCDCNPFF